MGFLYRMDDSTWMYHCLFSLKISFQVVMRIIFLILVLVLVWGVTPLVAKNHQVFSSEIVSSALSSPSDHNRQQIRQDTYYKVQGTVSGPRAPRLTEVSYPTEFGESRVWVWIVAQQHLYWSGFVVGALFFVTMCNAPLKSSHL